MRVSDILRTSPYLLIESLKTKNVTSTRTQILDTVHASKLQKTLKHFRLFEDRPLIDGDILPPCFHLIYFNPILAETQLSTDGADKTFNPGEPFTRRMWSGGKMIWVAENPLKLGQSVKEITSLEKVESKRTRDGKTMIVVTGKKDYHNEQGLALSDMRSWLFREPTKEIVPQRAVQPHEILKGTVVGKVKASEVTLFRYSALTFNSHKIHYDRQWCREVEGQNDLVVHGPLNITLLANVFETAFGRRPKSLKYRAVSPVLVNQEYSLMHDDTKVWAGAEGRTIMWAEEDNNDTSR